MIKKDWEYDFEVIMEAFEFMALHDVSDSFLDRLVEALPSKEWQYEAEIRITSGKMQIEDKK